MNTFNIVGYKWICCVLLIVSCGGSGTRPVVDALDELVEASDSQELQENAPVAWAEARRYLAMAREMEVQGDKEQADRFVVLGTIQLKIARSRAKQAALRDRLSDAERTKQALKVEIDSVFVEIRNLEAQMERERIRRHLVAVVEETRLLAAAQEERRERFLKKGEKKALTTARFQVGYEMIERAEVWKAIIGILVVKGVLEKGDINLVSGPLVLAREALERRDLATVQRLVESCGVEARSLVDRAWERAGNAPDGVLKDVLSKLDASGFHVTTGEFGATWGLAVSAEGSGKQGKKAFWKGRVDRMVAIVRPYGDVHCLVLASSRRGESETHLAESESQRMAATVADAVVASGLPEARVNARGSGIASPLGVPGEDDMNVAVIFLAIPKTRR